jgi:DNA-binding transcriptional MerR regulator
MSEALFTLRDLARELGLPESTVRFYRDSFAAYLPAVGHGRRRRYPAEALGLLRFIGDSFSQNRRREDIDAVLAEMTGVSAADMPAPEPLVPPEPMRAIAQLPVTTRRGVPTANDDAVATLLEGERDRREVMWQIAREIVRLGEAIERQHMFLEGISRRIDQEAGHLLPAASDASGEVSPRAADEATSNAKALSGELDRLREELKQERELVERLRKAKLQIERRAADAESRAGEA